jgi:hypothetical protein
MNSGLDYAMSAHDDGILIAPVYFLPIYDHRVDANIHSDVIPASSVEEVTNVSATDPFGEIIWNVSSPLYALTTLNDNYIISADGVTSASGGGGITVISNPVQSQKWQVNSYDGDLLTNHFAATSASFNEASSTWSLTGATSIIGNNISPLIGRSRFFKVVDYYPSSADAGVRGTVKCRLAGNIGTVKFNKIAVYAIRYENGVDTGEDPVLFGEAYTKTLLVKANEDGLTDITLDIQIQIQSLSASDYSEVFYSTSGDYFARAPSGIYYPEKVGIGSFDGSVFPMSASLHVRKSRTAPAELLHLAYDDDNYAETDVTSAGATIIKFGYGSGSSKYLSFDPANGKIYPYNNSGFDLGDLSNRFGSGLFSGIVSVHDYGSQSYMSIDAANKQMSASDDVCINFNEDAANFSADSEKSTIRGADIAKLDRDLAVYTTYDDGEITDDRNVYLVGGVSSDIFETSAYTPCSATDQFGFTHKNLINKIKESLLDGDYGWLKSASKINLISKGGIDIKGQLDLDMITKGGDGNYFNYGHVGTRKAEMLFTSSPSSADVTVYNIAENVRLQYWTTLDTLINSPQFTFIGSINAYNNVSPMINESSASSLGIGEIRNMYGSVTTVSKRWNRLFVKDIGSYYQELYDSALNNYGDNRVDHVYAKEVGIPTNTTSRVNRMAIHGLLNLPSMDIGWVHNTSGDAGQLYGDPIYTDTVAGYGAYYGIWPKRYLTLGNYQDWINILVAPTTHRDGVGRTIWQIYANKIALSNNLEFYGAFNLMGWCTGSNTSTDPLINNISASDETLIAGIHPTLDNKIIIGEASKRIKKIYATNIVVNEISAASYDIGWTELSASCSAELDSGSGSASATMMSVLKIGGMVAAVFDINYDVSAASADGVFITMPSGYEPDINQTFTAFGPGNALSKVSSVYTLTANIFSIEKADGTKITSSSHFTGSMVYRLKA